MGARRAFPDDKSWKRRRGNAGGKERRMLSVVTDAQAHDELGLDLDQLVREGARRMLAAALEAEVDDDLATHTAERDEAGRRLVVGNGHARQRIVLTAARGDPSAGAAGGRPPGRPGTRAARAVALGGAAAVVPTQPQGGRGAGAAVAARAVHRRLRARPGGVLRLWGGAVGRGGRPAADRLAGQLPSLLPA